MGSGIQPRWPKVKDYIPNETDKTFRQWLNDWRRETNEDTFGRDRVGRPGCSNIMLDDTLELICDAAHNNLIASVDDLYKETRWHLTGKHGQTLVDKIKEIIPAAPRSKPKPKPKPRLESNLKFRREQPKPHPTPVPKPPRCSSCGLIGHNSERFPVLRHTHVLVISKSQNGHGSAQTTCRVRLNGSGSRVAEQAKDALSIIPRALHSALNQRPANLTHHI